MSEKQPEGAAVVREQRQFSPGDKVVIKQQVTTLQYRLEQIEGVWIVEPSIKVNGERRWHWHEQDMRHHPDAHRGGKGRE